MSTMPLTLLAAVQLIVLVLIADLSSVNAATAQVATLIAADGRKLTLTGSKSPDLRTEHFDNITVSATVSGIWILYDDYNYTGESQVLTDKYENFNNLEHGLQFKVSSIRYAGSALIDIKSTLTLYKGTGYRDEDAVISDNQPNLDWNPLSLIVMGHDPWTVFSASNFSEGSVSVCMFPPAFYETHETDLSNSSIRSVHQGCAGASPLQYNPKDPNPTE